MAEAWVLCAMAWEKRVRACWLNVPTFGHFPDFFDYKCFGSANAIHDYNEKHPELIEVFAYFNAAAAAKYITIPTLVTPALFDPVVLPPGQFAVNNAIPEKYRKTVILLCGHFQTPENNEILKEVHKLKTELFTNAPSI